MVILIFERSQQITERLIGLISETIRGISFRKANTYKEALELLDEYNPQAVLLDLDFPDDTAISLLQAIKGSGDQTVAIVLYTMADQQKIKLFEENGADFMFDKYHEFEKIPGVIMDIPGSKKG